MNMALNRAASGFELISSNVSFELAQIERTRRVELYRKIRNGTLAWALLLGLFAIFAGWNLAWLLAFIFLVCGLVSTVLGLRVPAVIRGSLPPTPPPIEIGDTAEVARLDAEIAKHKAKLRG